MKEQPPKNPLGENLGQDSLAALQEAMKNTSEAERSAGTSSEDVDLNLDQGVEPEVNQAEEIRQQRGGESQEEISYDRVKIDRFARDLLNKGPAGLPKEKEDVSYFNHFEKEIFERRDEMQDVEVSLLAKKLKIVGSVDKLNSTERRRYEKLKGRVLNALSEMDKTGGGSSESSGSRKEVSNDPVTDEEYNEYVDNNKVSENRLNSIARKVAYRKGGSTESVLSEREKAIFANKTPEIRKIIAGFNKEYYKIAEEKRLSASDKELDKAAEEKSRKILEEERERAFQEARRRVHESIDDRFDRIKEENKKRDAAVDERVVGPEILSSADKDDLLERYLKVYSERDLDDMLKEEVMSVEGTKEDKARRLIEAGFVEIDPEDEFDPVSGRVLDILDKMNLSQDQIEGMSSNFYDLSEAQQVYVLEKLRQQINLDAEIEAKEKVEAVLRGKTDLFSREWFKKQKFKFTKEFQEDKFKKESISRTRKYNMSRYSEDLGVLSNHVKELGIDMSFDEGRLIFNFESPQLFEKSPDYAKRFGKSFDPEALVEKFNLAATKLSEIPYEWTTSRATSKERRAYKLALQEYDKQKTIIGGAKLEAFKSEMSSQQAEEAWRLWSDSLDTRIKMHRTLVSNPEIGDMASDPTLSPDANSVLNFAANLSNWSKGSGAALFGAGLKYLSKTTLAFGGGIVVAGAVGGFLGFRKKALEYSEKERKKRYGEGVEDSGVKKYINASEYVLKAQGLIDRLDKAMQSGDRNQIERIARFTRNRIFVIDQRISEGRVDFGKKAERLKNMTRLQQVMSEAQAKLFLSGAYSDDENSDKLLRRFNNFLGDKKATRIQNWKKAKAALWGATIAGAAFWIGWKLSGAEPEYDPAESNRIVPSVAPRTVVPDLESGMDASGSEAIDGSSAEPLGVDDGSNAELKSKTDVEIEKTEPVVDETARIKENIREIKTADGDLYEMEVRNKLKVPEVMEFKKDPQNFLVPDMTEAQAKQVIRPVEDQIREHIAWKNVLKVYPEGSPQHEWINSEMERLSGEIRNGLPEGVEFKGLGGVEVTPSPEIETPEIKGFSAPSGASNPAPDFENVKEAYQDAGFEHEPSGFGDVFSKEVPMETQNDLAQNYYENGYQGDPEVLEKARENVSEITGINGEIQDMNIRDIAKIEDVKSFRGNAGKFLIDDMSKSGLSEEFQTRSWGIKSLNSVRNQAEEFLAWKEYIKAYPEGSPQYELIRGKMTNLGEEIRGKVGNIFAPYEEMNGVPRPKIDPENLYPPQPENPTAKIESFKAPEVLASVDETAGDAAETPIRGFKAPANIETPEVATPKISVNEDVVTPSVENGSTTLDFNSEEVAGKLSFVEDSEGNLEIKESPDFSTEAGKEFRANPRKFISQEDIDKTVVGLRKDGVNATPKSVIDRYEDFINRREALRVSGLPLDSKEALAFKTEMKGIESIFEKHTGTGLVDRIGAVESGRGIESLVPEELEPEVSEPGVSENEIIKTSNAVIDPEGEFVNDIESKYGEAEIVNGNVLKFADGKHVGFYAESDNLNIAIERAGHASVVNKETLDLGQQVDRMARQRLSDGKYKVVLIYKKIN